MQQYSRFISVLINCIIELVFVCDKTVFRPLLTGEERMLDIAPMLVPDGGHLIVVLRYY